MAGIPGPGDRIEARCTRCNDVTGHVVVALVGGVIVKVECKACGSVHKYYPPAPVKTGKEKTSVCRVKPGEDRKNAVTTAPAPRAASGRAAAATSLRATKALRAAEEVEQSWQRAINLSAAAPQPYAMDGVFATGDVLEHPKFGMGVVQQVLPPDKVQVLFRDGSRMLRCAS